MNLVQKTGKRLEFVTNYNITFAPIFSAVVAAVVLATVVAILYWFSLEK
jgi:hypothetical protein